ncbi:MAG: site-2 protease family protein [Caldilineaceae bacterium]
MTDHAGAPPRLQMTNMTPNNLSFVSTQGVTGEICRIVENDLAIDTVESPREPQRAGILVLRGQLRRASAEVFPRWLSELTQRGYTPVLRHDPAGDTNDHVILRVMKGVAPKSLQNPLINLLLFILTVGSTLLIGSLNGPDPIMMNGQEFVARSDADIFRLYLYQFTSGGFLKGWPFALTLLGILLAHEFGHYFAARYHKVAVTLPYFIPLPVGFGTLGAFIRLKEPISDRRKLFDIGVAGPLAGLVLAVPLLFVGLSLSPVGTLPPGAGGFVEGNSLLYYFAKIWVFGQPLPNLVTGQDVLMGQVNFAAWIGLLVTALNLLPVGQLDGGHTVFALFGEKARYINIATMVIMGGLAVAGLFPMLGGIGFSGWFVWLGLILLVIGPFHPPALDDVTELDNRRRLIGYFVILIFIITFVPTPFRPI